MTTDLVVAANLRNIILAQNIVPQTTLTAQATAGATTITVADATHFPVNAVVFFSDTLGEEMLTVASKSGSVITLSFTGLGYSSLKYTHTNGTVVYTNLLDFAPNVIGDMLTLGDPLVWVMPLKERTGRPQFRTTQPTYRVLIQYHRLMERPQSQGMHTNVWSRRQQQAARADLETIAKAIRTNPRLTGTNNTMVEDLGELKSSQPVIEKDWSILVKDMDIKQFAAALTVTVRGGREIF